MPLLPGKRNIGRNIETEKNAGKTHDQALAIALNVARKHREKGGSTISDNPLISDAINAVSAWKTAGKPNHNWIQNGHIAKSASQAVGKLQDSFRSLPRGQYWRGTNDPTEPSRLTPDFSSTNHITGKNENGLSVSHTPATIAAYGYSHAYPVTGTVNGVGSDGEPLLANPRPMGPVLPAKKLLEQDRQRVKSINTAFDHVATQSGVDKSIIGWLGSRYEPTSGMATGGRTRQYLAEGGSADDRFKPKNFLHTGPIHSSVAGRTDHLPIHVPSGSYVLPADVVSAGGEGNTMSGFKVLRRTFGGESYGQSTHPYGQSKGPYGSGSHPYDKEGGPYDSPAARATGGQVRHRAAGILFISPEKEVLLMRRRGKDHAGEWALPAGGIEKGETPEQAARRETEEEAGYSHEGGLSPFMHSKKEGVDFTTFVAHSDKFAPKINQEHDSAVWITPEKAVAKLPLHPGVKKALEKLNHRSGKAHGGAASGVPIVAAGGEWVIPPHHVEAVGGGDIDRGHRVLDDFVKRVRKELIGTLQKLPGPRRD